MTKIGNHKFGIERSKVSSTHSLRMNTLKKLTRSYVLNFRNLTIAICFVFLAVSAQAQTADVDKNWTTVGSAGTLDESSVGRVVFDHGIVQMGSLLGGTTSKSAKRRALIVPQTHSAVIRYNVTPVDGFFVPRRCTPDGSLDVRLRLRYLAAGPGARVIAKLVELDLATGREKTLLTFDSGAPNLPRSDNYQVQSNFVCGRPWNYDFENKAYYVEAALTTGIFAGFSAAGIQMIQIDNFTRPF